jgi:hypothetical protein
MGNLTKLDRDGTQPGFAGDGKGTFCGTDAGFYISKALCQAISLENLTMMENIKFKQVVQTMSAADVITDSNCDFTNKGTLTLGERIIQPKDLQINLQLCKSVLESNWEALKMRAGAWNDDVPSFNEYVISLMAEHIAHGVEHSIWTGAGATTGEFEGFTTAGTGSFASDATVNSVANAGTPFDETNIIANLDKLVANIPSCVYGKEDLKIYMNQKSYMMYISAVSKLGYVNAYNMNGDYVPLFNGISIARTNGMSDNELVAAQKSNLFFGTDLVSDTTEIRLLDMTMLDGSNNIRLVAKYSGGIQHGIGADITWLK